MSWLKVILFESYGADRQTDIALEELILLPCTTDRLLYVDHRVVVGTNI